MTTNPCVPVLALLIAVPVSAQAPRITPSGDPSVLADTIYALALDSAEYPDDKDGLILLDDGVLVRERDGTGSTTYRTVAQVLTRAGVEGWAELTFGFDAVREDLRLNWARVVAPDGRVISTEPALQQIMDAPVAEASPVFTDRKTLRLSLAGVEPGTIVDFSTTTVTKQPLRPGDFQASWLITMPAGVRRSRYLVDVPADYELDIVDTPSTIDPRVTVRGNRRVYEWSASDLGEIESEYFEVREERPGFQRVRLASRSSWAEIGAWYAGLARERYALTPDVVEAAEQVVGGARGLAALRALHRWVAQDFRYVSISLGIGGYQPRFPSDVLQTRSGDCKDKATLFIALARRYGFEAYPVLLHSTGGVEEGLPSIQAFNHAIAAVRIDGTWTYLDLTANIVPFGEIPGGYQGEFGLLVRDDGAVEEVTFPLTPPEANASHETLEGTLTADGGFVGRAVSRASGVVAHELRSMLARDPTPEEVDRFAQGMASVVEGGRGSNPVLFRGLDLEADVVLGVDIASRRATRQNVGGGQIFILPIDSHANPDLVAELEAEPSRQSPIDIDAVLGPVSTMSEIRLTLPAGWTAQLPEDVVAESRFGSYEARYSQNGDEVHVLRRITGATGTAPREAFPELVQWLREIARDETVFLLLQPAAE